MGFFKSVLKVISVAAPLVGAFFGPLGAIVGGAISLGTGVLSREKQQAGGFRNTQVADPGQQVNTQSSVGPLPVYYGETRVGGNIIFQHEGSREGQAEYQNWLHVQIALGAGPIGGLKEIWFEDRKVYDRDYIDPDMPNYTGAPQLNPVYASRVFTQNGEPLMDAALRRRRREIYGEEDLFGPRHINTDGTRLDLAPVEADPNLYTTAYSEWEDIGQVEVRDPSDSEEVDGDLRRVLNIQTNDEGVNFGDLQTRRITGYTPNDPSTPAIDQSGIDKDVSPYHWNFEFFDGTQTQPADRVANWPDVMDNTRIGHKTAYLWISFKYDPEIFPGVPKVFSVIEGKMSAPLDSRQFLTTTGDVANPTYSRNPARVLLDILIDRVDGAGGVVDVEDDIDLESFRRWEAYCDEHQRFLDGPRYTVNGGGQPRGGVDRIIDDILTSTNARIVEIGGRLGVVPLRAEEPVDTIRNSDIVGDINLAEPASNNVPNRIIVRYRSRENNYEDNSVVISDDRFLEEDNGVVSTAGEVYFGFINETDRAKALGYQILRQQRLTQRLQFVVPFNKYHLTPMSVINVELDDIGTMGTYRIMEMTHRNSDNGVEISLECIEHDNAAYEDVNPDSVSIRSYRVFDRLAELARREANTEVRDDGSTTPPGP